MRLSSRLAAFLALVVVAITCTDAPTGPGSTSPMSASSLRLNPSFSSEAARVYGNLASFGIEVTEVHVRLIGADGSVRDTVIAFPVGQDQVTIEIPVAGASADQPFTALLELRNDAHVVLFSGTQTVTARPSGAPTAPGSSITIQYAGPGRGTKAVSISPSDVTVAANASVTATATATDSSDRAVTDLLVRWTASDPTIATVTQTSSTTASVAGTGKRGVITLTATTPQGVAGTARFSFIPAASKVVLVSGAGQTGVAGSALPQPMVVEVQATDNQPVPGVPVTFRSVTAGGSVATSSAVSDANGRASTILTLGRTAGAYQFEAASGTLTVATAGETATAAPASALTLVSGDGQADSIGRPLAQPLVVKVADQFGGAVSGATVSWTRSGSGSLGSATTTTGADGTSANSYTLGATVGTDTIRASVAGIGAPVQFLERAASRGPATIVIVSGASQSAAPGAPFTIPLVVRVNDALGNPVSGTIVSFGAAGGVTFSAASAATGATGQATTVITAGLTPGSYGVTASAGTASVSTSLTVTTATPGSITKAGGDNQSATVNTNVAVAPSVLVKDAAGNPAQGVGVTFAVASGGGSITGATATTNASGIAAVGSWKLGATSGANTLTATSGSSSTTFTATGTSSSATKFTIVQGPPATITVGAPIPAIKLQVADANGNAVAQGGVSVTLTGTISNNTDGSAGGSGPMAELDAEMFAAGFSATVTTDANGLATFNLSPYAGSIGSASIAITATGLTTLTFPALTVVAGAASQLVLTQAASPTVGNGQAFAQQPIVCLADAGGNRLSQAGVSVTAAIATGGGALGGTAIVATGANGCAAFTGLSITGTAGARTLSFSATGLTGVASGAITIGAGTAGVMTKNAGDAQAAPAGSAVAINPSVLVADGSGNPVANVSVTFSTQAGNGTVTGATAVTNASGIATVGSWTLNNVPGVNTLTATAGALTVSFTATGSLGAPAKLVTIAPVPTTIHVADPLAAFASVRIADAAGNPVAQSGVTVHYSATIQPANQSQSGDVVTDASGVAVFPGAQYDGPIGSLTFSASATGLTTYTSPTVQVLTGPAARISIVTQPSATSISTQPFAQQPVLQIQDAGHNPVSQSGLTVTAKMGFGGGSVVGTTAVSSDANGVVTYTNLGIAGFIGGHSLMFNLAALDSVVSNQINVGVGAGAAIAILQGNNQTSPVNANTLVQPQVKVTDAFGNGVPNVNVTFTPRSGSRVSGSSTPLTVVTSGNGTANVSWQLGPAAGSLADSLDVTAAGLTGSPVLFVASATAGTPIKYIMITQPPASSASGVVITPAPKVQLVDQFGNPTAGAAGFTVTATMFGGGVLTGTTTATTDANGFATFPNLIASGTAGSRTLQFSEGTHQFVTSSPFTLTGGTAAKLGFVGGNWTVSGSTVSAQPFATQPQIQVLDANNNPVAGTYIIQAQQGIGPAAGILNNSVTTDPTGKATFTQLAINGFANSYSLIFKESGNTLTSIQSPVVTITSAPAAKLSIRIQPPAAGTIGSPFPQQPVLQVTDTAGYQVNLAGVSVTAQIATGGGTLTGTTTVVSSAVGEVIFNNLAISGPAGPRTLSFTATNPALQGATSTSIVLAVGPPANLAVTTAPPVSTVSGAVLSPAPVVQVRDIGGNNVNFQALTVTAGVIGGGSLSGATTVNTDATGRAVFNNLILTGTGTPTLTFSAPITSGIAGTSSAPIQVGAGTAASIAIVDGNNQVATVGTNTANPLRVKVTDALGNAVSGVSVTFSPRSGSRINGSATPISQATPPNGIVQLPWQMGTTAGALADTIEVSASGLSGSPLLFVASATPGAPFKFVMATQPAPTQASGQVISPAPRVQLVDQFGNALTNAGGFNVTAVLFGGGTVSGTVTTPTDAAGFATFANLIASGTGGARTLQFGDASHQSISSSSFNLTGGTATRLGFVGGSWTVSGSTVSAQPFATQPQIQVLDANNNPVGGTYTILVQQGIGPAAGILNNTVTTDPNGRATFTQLAINGSANSYSLVFKESSNTLTSVQSPVVTITSAPAARLSIGIQPPANGTIGALFSPQPAIQITDTAGYQVNLAGVNVTAQIAIGGGTLTGTTTVVSNAVGQVLFSNLSIAGTAGARTLTFTSTNPVLQSVTSTNIVLAAGTPANLALTTAPPATTVSGAVLSPAPVVQVRDVGGNNVNFPNLSVTAGAIGISGTVTVNTDANGRAVFNNLVFIGSGTPTINFTTPNGSNVAGTSSSPVQVTAAPATNIAIVDGNNQVATVGANTTAAPQVKVTDAFGNAVSGVNVTFTPRSGSRINGSATPISQVTPANGIVQLPWQLGTAAGTLADTLEVSASGLSGSPLLFVASATAGVPFKYVMVTQPALTAASGLVLSPAPKVQLVDQYGNPTTNAGGFNVTAVLFGGGSASGTVTVLTDAAGFATFPNLVPSGTAGARTLQFGDGSHQSVSSSAFTLSGGSAARLGFVGGSWTVSGSTVSAQSFATQPQIQVLDANNNPVAGSYTIQVNVGTGPTGVVLHGTATTNGTSMATFTQLAINGTAGTYTLNFAEITNTLTSVQSPTLTLTSAPAALLVLKTAPSSSASSGSVLAQQPVLQVSDTAGYPIAQAGIVVTAQVGNGGSAGGSVTATSNSAGEIRFSGLFIAGSAGVRALTFTSPSLAGVTSGTINVTAGSATALSLSTQPPSTSTSGAVLSPAPVVQVVDNGGNIVTTPNFAVTVSVNGPGSVSGTTTVTTSGGTATFSNLVLSGTGTSSLQFATSGLSGVTSPSITVGPGAVNAVIPVTNAHYVATTHSTIPMNMIRFQVVDAGNTPIAGKSVTFNGSRADCSFSAGPVTSDGGGYVSVPVQVDSTPTGCTIFALADGKVGQALVTTVPAGATHAWFGGSTTNAHSFAIDGNWIRLRDNAAVAPSLSTDVPFIQFYVDGNRPYADADHTFAGLLFGTAATMSLNGHAFTVTGDALALGGVGGTADGKVVMAGSNNVASGIFDELQIGAPGCAGQTQPRTTVRTMYATTLSVNCTLLVEQGSASVLTANAGSYMKVLSQGSFAAATSFSFGGDSLFLADSATLGANGDADFGGRLMFGGDNSYMYMTGSGTFHGGGTLTGGYIDVGRNATFGGAGSSGYTFQGGQLMVGGNFAQVSGGSLSAFVADGRHYTLFENGDPSSQTISFADPSSNAFGILLIANDAGVTFTTDATMPSTEYQRSIAMLAGSLIIPADRTVNLRGSLVIDEAPSLVTVNGRLYLNQCTSYVGSEGYRFDGTGLINGETTPSFYSCFNGNTESRTPQIRATALRQVLNRMKARSRTKIRLTPR